MRPFIYFILLMMCCQHALRAEAQPPQWSLGIYFGEDPGSLRGASRVENPVLRAKDVTDRDAVFVADPFLFPHQRKWFLFFEVMDQRSRHGDIGLAVSNDAVSWRYVKVALDEDFHLSYPMVFEHNGEHYMLPETRKKKAVRLYRASNFPFGWHHVKNLVRGNFADPSIFKVEDTWWLFAVEGGHSLCAFYAKALFGPWHAHSLNPIYKDENWRSRPAGRPLVLGDRVIRFAQDGGRYYGHQVRAFEVTQLTPDTFEENELASSPILFPHGDSWRGHGMHHVDAWKVSDGQWIAAVDGSGWPNIQVAR